MAINRKYPRKFCVIKQEDPDVRNGQSGFNYWVAAEWSYHNGKVSYVMDWTPNWLYKIIDSCCPNNDEDCESDFWIPDSEIDALKAKANFYAEIGVTMTDSSWNTHSEEEKEQEETEEAQEQSDLDAFNNHFFSNIKPGTLILMNTASNVFIGKTFAVGEFVRTDKDSNNNITVVLKDPTIIASDDSCITSQPKFTNKTGEESFLDASYGKGVKSNILPITDPNITKDMILQRFIPKKDTNNIKLVKI